MAVNVIAGLTVATVLLASLSTGGCQSQGQRVALTAESVAQESRRIDLGTELFVSGSREFAPGAECRIAAALASIPAGSRLRVSVFDQKRPPRIEPPRGPVPLSQYRADAMKTRLELMGYVVIDAVGHGVVTVDGRPPSRRVEVHVVAFDG